ncbi:hypothetical protein MSG28_013044 [Choristoneura fumiferana]|uniref:Uncharacterized protein n=1 Tax=Choristoneura fumiferana TaxID=7141 RepID=A0ACC0KRZ0_CHOFU|nr:hypothetical protein MSG28_013044 [Choristoneura fumiferana]
MLVLSNIFRASHPQKMTQDLSSLSTDTIRSENPKIVSHNSLRVKQRTKTQDNIANDMDVKTVRREKCLSISVDAIPHNNSNSKVICSAKGLLETNLDDLFNDEWVGKSLGSSEPTLSYEECRSERKRGSLVSEDDSEEDSTTDSDGLDEVVREQRKCMGARRFGHMLRRVISRNGEFLQISVCRPATSRAPRC